MHFPCVCVWPDLSEPAAVVEHLKLEQDLGQLVVVLDDLACLSPLQDDWMLLESLHGLLYAPEQLAGPRDLT